MGVEAKFLVLTPKLCKMSMFKIHEVYPSVHRPYTRSVVVKIFFSWSPPPSLVLWPILLLVVVISFPQIWRQNAVFAINIGFVWCVYVVCVWWVWAGCMRKCSGTGGMSNVKCWAQRRSLVRFCLITIRILNILA